jgi:hypothetical protein
MRSFLPALAALLLAARPLAAQVGVPPDQSPYRDITRPNALIFSYGHIGGGGGSLAIGPHDGDAWTLRYDVRLSGLLGAHLGFGHFVGVRDAYATGPKDSIATRRTTGYQQSVTFLGAGIQVAITGPKTWHRLAPYVDLDFGAAIGNTLAADTSSAYQFGTKLYFAPGVGVQWFLTPRVRLRGDAQLLYWKLKYPPTFFQAPPDGVTAAPIVTDPTKVGEWTGTGWLSLGLAVSF